jgi:hypothetical protein
MGWRYIFSAKCALLARRVDVDRQNGVSELGQKTMHLRT